MNRILIILASALALSVATGCNSTSNLTGPDKTNNGGNTKNGGTTTTAGKNSFVMNGDGYQNLTMNSSATMVTVLAGSTQIAMSGFASDGNYTGLNIFLTGYYLGDHRVSSSDADNQMLVQLKGGTSMYTCYDGIVTISSMTATRITGSFKVIVLNYYTGGQATVTGQFDAPVN